MKARFLIYICSALISCNAFASPQVFFDEITHTAGFTDLDNIPVKGDNCSINQGLMTVTGNQYSKSGRSIELIKFTRKDGEEFIIPTNFENLNNEENSKSKELAKIGGTVFIKFSTCGSGGYMSLIDILKPF